MHTTPSNTSDADARTYFFTLVDATDLKTPEGAVSVSGVKPTVFIGGAALSGTAADIVLVNATSGLYSWTATQAQVNVTAGKTLRGYIQPTGCALTLFESQIGPAALLSEPQSGTAIADALLDRDMATGTDSGSSTVRTVRQALRALRNKVSWSGGTATVTKEDDSTASWTATVTGTPTVTAVDPTGP